MAAVLESDRAVPRERTTRTHPGGQNSAENGSHHNQEGAARASRKMPIKQRFSGGEESRHGLDGEASQDGHRSAEPAPEKASGRNM